MIWRAWTSVLLWVFKLGILSCVVPDFLHVTSVIAPFKPVTLEEEYNITRLSKILGASPHVVKQCIEVAKEEGLDPLLFLSLVYTESTFNPHAVSSKGYHGLTQVKWKVPWTDVNLVLGARVLKEKLELANGNLYKALHLYKGYPLKSERGHQQVTKVIRIWRTLQRVTFLENEMKKNRNT